MKPYRFQIITGSQRGDITTGRSDFYWRLRAPNGRITADGAEGYSTWGKCYRAIEKLVTVFGAGKFLMPERPKVGQ